MRLPRTSEVDTAAVEVPSHSANTASSVEVSDTAQVELPGFREEEEFRCSSHGQQEQLPAVSIQDNKHIQTGNNSRMNWWSVEYKIVASGTTQRYKRKN